LDDPTYQLRPVGQVESSLTDRDATPKRGDEVLVLTWLHQGRRDALSVHPRGDTNRPRAGVFATRSPDRPNPIGLHPIRIENVEENAITVHNLEAIEGTPVLDIKPVL
jgi:tRNA-Thr(GGU) m(6)t(6)A37 methyltransferase TsaA